MKYGLHIVLGYMLFSTADVTVINASELLRHNPFEKPEISTDMSQAKNKIILKNEMKLRGTLIDGKDSMANIDGKFYRINQQVAGYRVIRIKRTSVTLQSAGSEMVLTLNNYE